MKKLLVLLATFIGGSVGWWLGAFVGTLTAFILSMVGTGLGLYFGAKVAAEYQ